MCSLKNISRLPEAWSTVKAEGSNPATDPVNIRFRHQQQRWAGPSRYAQAPVGRQWDSENPFCGNSPWSHSPRLAGWSKQLEGRSSWETFLSKCQWNLPQSRTSLFPRLLSPGSSRASASQGFYPGYWCPLPTSGRTISLLGAEKGRLKTSANLCQKASNAIHRPSLGVGNAFPFFPQPDRVPHTATHLQRDDMVTIKSCTWDGCECCSEPQHPCHSQPLSSQQKQSWAEVCKKSPASVGLFSMNSPLSTYWSVSPLYCCTTIGQGKSSAAQEHSVCSEWKSRLSDWG